MSVADGVVSLSTLATKSRQHVLVHISARSEAEDAATREWAERLMKLAYDGELVSWMACGHSRRVTYL